MKIAFLIHSFSAGGAEKQFNMLSTKLSEKGYENFFIVTDNFMLIFFKKKNKSLYVQNA